MAQDYSQDVNGLGSPMMATLIPYQIAPEGDKNPFTFAPSG